MGATKRLQEDMDRERDEIIDVNEIEKETIDFNRFTIRELKSYLDNEGISITQSHKIKEDDIIHIPEIFNTKFYKGSENLYFNVDIYMEERRIFETFNLNIWTKDQHEELKQLVLEILKKI